MKHFVEPTIEYAKFEVEDVLTVSSFGGEPELPLDPF